VSILLHQPSPWELHSGGQRAAHQSEIHAKGHLGPIALVGFHDNMAGEMAERHALDNAKFIIRAVNAHYDLLEACKEILALIDDPNISETKKCFKLGPNFSLARKIEKAIQKAEGK